MDRRGRDEWAKRVQRWKRSGLGARAFAQREGLKPKTLWWWSWRLAQEKGARRVARPSFVELVMPAAAPAVEGLVTKPALEVVLGAVRVVVPQGFDSDCLRQVLAIVEGR